MTCSAASSSLGAGSNGLDANEVTALALAAKAQRRVELVLPMPQQLAELEVVEAQLLRDLAP